MKARERSRCKAAFKSRHSRNGKVAKTYTVSFYPEHVDTLRQREKELNVPWSLCLQLLVELERQAPNLRRELIKRLNSISGPGSMPLIPNTPSK